MTRDNHWTVDMGLRGGFIAFAVDTLTVISTILPFWESPVLPALGRSPHQKFDDDDISPWN